MAHDVVISYSRRNREIADRFAVLLRERGLAVWYDRMIKTGSDWRDEIARSIAGARSLVVLFSEESNESDELKKELAIADRRGLLIIPVRIENIEPLGLFEYELARRQWFDAYDDWRSQLPLVADAIVDALKTNPTAGQPSVETVSAAPPTRERPASPAISAAGRRDVILLGVNLALGLLPPYLFLWLMLQILLAKRAGVDRPWVNTVTVFACATLVAAIIAAIVLVDRSPITDNIVGVVTGLIAVVGLSLMGLVAWGGYVRQRSRALFWLLPIAGTVTIAISALATSFTPNTTGYGDYQVHKDFFDRAAPVLALVSVGMTMANGAYLYDAWVRFKGSRRAADQP